MHGNSVSYLQDYPVTMKQLFFFLLAISLFSCEDENAPNDCLADMLAQYDMVAYTGQQEGECANFLTMYVLFGKQYFQLGNPCAMMIFNPVNCSGEKICEDGNNTCANTFLKLAEYKGTVGIRLSE